MNRRTFRRFIVNTIMAIVMPSVANPPAYAV